MERRKTTAIAVQSAAAAKRRTVEKAAGHEVAKELAHIIRDLKTLVQDFPIQMVTVTAVGKAESRVVWRLLGKGVDRLLEAKILSAMMTDPGLTCSPTQTERATLTAVVAVQRPRRPLAEGAIPLRLTDRTAVGRTGALIVGTIEAAG